MLKHFIQKHTLFLGITALAVIITTVFFAHQAKLFSRYDNEYLRDLYDHSQWTIAKSVRSISDGDLYQVAGYDFIHTSKFFSINPEVPVLSKYLFGYSITFFGNAYLIGFISYLLSLVLLFFIAIKLLSIKQSLYAVILYAMDPLVASNAGAALLDLPQLVFLLLHIFAMLTLYQKNTKPFVKIIMLALASISLGGFISFKFGWLGLVILASDAFLLWKMKKLWHVVIIGGGMGLFYVSTYIQYFLQGHSILDFLKVQKWVVIFYLQSGAPHNPLNEIATIFFGFNKGWSIGDVWTRVPEWTLLWPTYAASVIIIAKNYIKKKIILRWEIEYLTVLAILLFICYLYIPFFTRYLILFLPLLILIFVTTIPKQVHKISSIIIGVALIFFVMSLPSSPGRLTEPMSNLWGKGIYQDMFRFLDEKTKHDTNRLTFWQELQQFENDWGIRNRKITFANKIVFPWQNKVVIPATIAYTTDIGIISFTKPIQFQRQANKWRMVWNPTYTVPGNTLHYKLIKNVMNNNFGSIINSDTGDVLIHQGMWKYVYVTPKMIVDDTQVIAQLKTITGLAGYDIETKYKANAYPNQKMPIGFLLRDFSEAKFQTLVLDPGISWDIQPTYVFNNLTNIKYKNVEYDNLVQTYIEIIRPIAGGTIASIEDATGRETVLITKEGRDGKTVKISTAEILRY